MVRRIPPVVATARGKGGGGGGLSAPPPLCTQVTLFSRYPTQHTKKNSLAAIEIAWGAESERAREREGALRRGDSKGLGGARPRTHNLPRIDEVAASDELSVGHPVLPRSSASLVFGFACVPVGACIAPSPPS